MTTTELIKKVHKIASKFLKVRIVTFGTRLDFSDMTESMTVTVFYQQEEFESNLSAAVYSFQDEKYTVNRLFKELESELEKFNNNAIKSVEVNF